MKTVQGSGPETTISPSFRIAILQRLVPTAMVRVAHEMEAFASRLENSLLKLSEQTVKAGDASLSYRAFNKLRSHAAQFQRKAMERCNTSIRNEIRLLEKAESPTSTRQDDYDLSLVTFEEMESKVLLGNISQSLERDISEPLGALNIRIGQLTGRELGTSDNPFRPQTFLVAVYDAWCEFDSEPESRRLVLRQLGPEVFLELTPILQELNSLLVEQGILPDLTEAYRLRKAKNKIGLPPEKAPRDESRHSKVRRWLLSSGKNENQGGADDLQLPDLFGAGGESAESFAPQTISVRVGPRLFGHLNNLQKQLDQLGARSDALLQNTTILRQVKENLPAGSLTVVDENTIELLARIFDYIFDEKQIPVEMKKLIGQLQIPLLKAALLDKKFFIKDDHPARRLIDTLAKTSVAWDQQKGHDDPLYKMIEQIVKRVQVEFDQQMGLFTDVVSNLEYFLSQEEKVSESALREPIAEALRQERLRVARQAAENDIAVRIETGEVAGFVEVFLEAQWTRILTMGHSVKEQKPEVLAKGTKAMDDLIWSVKPKNSPKERRELITRLPSILSMVNAWLNAVKWDEPERVTFFSNLAERHAAIVRIQTELSARTQVEFAVNIAQKASDRRMQKQERQQKEKPRDKISYQVDGMEPGEWVAFVRNNGTIARFRLTWVSPQRSSFIFTNRQGADPFSFTAEELEQALRDRKATVVPRVSVVDRALTAALEAA